MPIGVGTSCSIKKKRQIRGDMLRGINRQDIFEDNEDYKQMTCI